MKWLFLPLLASTFLRAASCDNEELSSIYTEAILFVLVFGVMGIVSFIISKKHAKQYVQKNPTSKSDEEKRVQTSSVKPAQKRIIELSKLVNDGLLTDEEFQILKQAKEST